MVDKEVNGEVEVTSSLKAQLEESKKVIESLNKRLAKMIRLYNIVTELYMQEEETNR